MSDIDTIVQTVLKARIVEALSSEQEAIESLIKAALSQPVDEHGKPNRYREGQPYLDWLINDHIRDAASQAVRKHVQSEDIASVIRSAIQDAVKKEDVTDAISKALIGAAGHEWSINIQFEKERSDY